MFKNLIKYSLRSFKRQRVNVIINILGLSIGIACSLLIAFYVINEESYDRYNSLKDRIYRLNLDIKIGDEEMNTATTSAIMGPTILRELPEIESFMRMLKANPTIIEYNNKTFSEDHLVVADSTFFKFFSIPVLKGDPANLLNSRRKAVVSESVAKKIFGDENPVDKTIKIKLGRDTTLYTISGVMDDIHVNSHFGADIITSYMSDPGSTNISWDINNLSTYLLLKPNADYKKTDVKIRGLINKYIGPVIQQSLSMNLNEFSLKGNRYRGYLQNLTDIHLDTSVKQHFKEPGDPRLMMILESIAILILLIAAINFTNLSTAQASRREREVGIKKISGSSNMKLIAQFLSESFILSFISTIIGLGIIKIMLPWFNNIVGTSLELNLFARWYIVPLLILFSVIVGILSGGYPAFFLSSLSPGHVLKGGMKNSVRNSILRRVLVISQFTISVFLIIATLVMFRQIRFMLNKDLGFNKEHLLVIEKAEALGTRVKSFKEVVKTVPGVEKIASSTCIPGRNDNVISYTVEGNPDKMVPVSTNWIDYDYLETYGMSLATGRKFDESHSTDNQVCLVNEVVIKTFGITDPEKTRITRIRNSDRIEYFPIIGVVKNFHFESLRNSIAPYIYRFKTEDLLWGYITVKVTPGNYLNTISEIETIWKKFTINVPFKYFFLDDSWQQMYIREKQNAQMAILSSILAIFIAALGLFGLTSFTVEQRTREIGVRKAMGATIAEIYAVISGEVIILVSVASLIALPLIYYIANKWLENFYYRINIDALSLIAGFTIALGIALITISYRILKAAKINPAVSLKYE
jgi:putative ABC transport system permease protein